MQRGLVSIPVRIKYLYSLQVVVKTLIVCACDMCVNYTHDTGGPSDATSFKNKIPIYIPAAKLQALPQKNQI